MGTGELVKVIRKILKDDRKPQAIDTEAEVKRVEDGIAWVHIPGGVDETPVKLTIDAKTGDTVQVRVAKGRAWLVGNATRPPTDDTEAEKAQWAAAGAGRIARQADETATGAKGEAMAAQRAAQAARGSAIIANEAANGALCGLATVEDVIGVLERIQQHGTMTLTTDTAINPDHVYFVADPNGEYVVQNVHYSVVAEPKTSELSTYYELTIDESLNNYVMTHIAVTSEGLWILPDVSGGYKILIATGAGSTYTSPGTYIIDPNANVVAKFGSDVVIGQNASGKARTELGSDGMEIIYKDGAYDQQVAHLGYGQGAGQSGQSYAPYFTLGKRRGTKGNYSVVEGNLNKASGFVSHAEGDFTQAAGYSSHSEGRETEATGDYSHAGGNKTRATRKSQTVIGDGNVADTGGTDGTTRGNYIFIIGNGDGDIADYSNGLAVDWNGNIKIPGKIYAECDYDSGGGHIACPPSYHYAARANTMKSVTDGAFYPMDAFDSVVWRKYFISDPDYFDGNVNGVKIIEHGYYKFDVNAHMNSVSAGNRLAVQLYNYTDSEELTDLSGELLRRYDVEDGSGFGTLALSAVLKIPSNKIIIPRFGRYSGSSNFKPTNVQMTVTYLGSYIEV